MLQATSRLRSHEFNKVFSQGRSAHSASFSMRYLASNEYRAAVVVGKKYDKRRVVRNRLRRQVYAALRELSQKYSLPTWQVIIICKKTTKTLTYQDMYEELAKLHGVDI